MILTNNKLVKTILYPCLFICCLFYSGLVQPVFGQVTISAGDHTDVKKGESEWVYIIISGEDTLSSLSFTLTWDTDTACYVSLDIQQSLTLKSQNFSRDGALDGVLGFTYTITDSTAFIQPGDTLFGIQLSACGDNGTSTNILINDEIFNISALGTAAQGGGTPSPVSVLPSTGSPIGSFSIESIALPPVLLLQAQDEACAIPGSTIDVCIHVDSIVSFNILNFSLAWDTSMLELGTIDFAKDFSGINLSNFDQSIDGKLGFGKFTQTNTLTQGDTIFCLQFSLVGETRGSETAITLDDTPVPHSVQSFSSGSYSIIPDTGDVLSTITIAESPELFCKDVTLELPAEGKMKIDPDTLFTEVFKSCGQATTSVLPDSLFSADVGTVPVSLLVQFSPSIIDTCFANIVVDANGMPGPTAKCRDVTVLLDSTGTMTLPADSIDNGSLYTGTPNITVTPSTITCSPEGFTKVLLEITDNVRTDTCSSMVTTINTITINASQVVDCSGSTLSQMSTNYTGGIWSALSSIGTSVDNSGIVTLGRNLTVLSDTDTIMYTIGGCSDSVLVQSYPYPQTQCILEPGCPEDSLQLEENGNFASSWSWSGPDTFNSLLRAPIIPYAVPGWYSVTVTDPRGCTAADSVQMRDYAKVRAINGGPYCAGEIGRLYELGGDAVAWEWQFPSGFVSIVKNPAISPVIQGQCIVSIVDSSGCKNTDTTEICVSTPQAVCTAISTVVMGENGYAQPVGSVFGQGSLASSCSGIKSYTITPSTFACMPDGFQPATLTITDSVGCKDQCQTLVAVVDTSSPTTSPCGCTGVDLFESGDLEEAQYSASGTIESDGVIQAGVHVSFRAAETITLQPGFSALQGSIFSAQIGTCGSPAIEETLTGEELFAVPDISTPVIRNRENPMPAQAESFSSFHSSVWPNPTSKACTLSFTMPTPGTVQITLWSPHGHLIATPLPNSPFPKGNFQIPIPTQNLPKGIYFLNINSSTGHQTTHRLAIIGN